MPQIRIEYTANLDASRDFQPLFEELHGILVNIGGVRLNNCKSRAICHEQYRIGDGDLAHAFVHLTLQLMAGRSRQWKRDVGNRFLDALMRFFKDDIDAQKLQVTVNIGDIAQETYFKHPSGTLTKNPGGARKAS